jgi:hypothetical protein
MDKLNDLANLIGFGNFWGMIGYFTFLLLVFLFGMAIYKGQKK